MVEVTMELRHGRTVERRHQRALRVPHALSILRCSIVRGGSDVRHVTEEFVVTSTFNDGATYTVVYTGSESEMATLTAFATRATRAAAALAA